MVQDAAQRAGLAQRVTPHRLRASVATLLLDAGMPIDQVQKFLRDKHLGATKVSAETSLKSLGEHYLRALYHDRTRLSTPVRTDGVGVDQNLALR